MPKALAWVVPLGLLAVLVVRVSLVPALTPAGAGTEEARAEVADAMRADEPAFRRDALERFAGDPWSQGDHFGAREHDRVRELARAKGIRPGAVLDAIDRDVKSHAFDGPLLSDRGRVAVCMPRPFYE